MAKEDILTCMTDANSGFREHTNTTISIITINYCVLFLLVLHVNCREGIVRNNVKLRRMAATVSMRERISSIFLTVQFLRLTT